MGNTTLDDDAGVQNASNVGRGQEVRSDQAVQEEAAAAARRGVGLACNFCRRSHALCETKRPCTRCEKAGRAHLCADVPLRKRGRPSKSDRASASGSGRESDHGQRRRDREAPLPLPTNNTQRPAVAACDVAATTLPLQLPSFSPLPSPGGFDSLPFYTLSPRTPHTPLAFHHDAPATITGTGSCSSGTVRPQQVPSSPMAAPPSSSSPSTHALYANALDMMADELRRARDENEKLRAELKKTKTKLKLKKFEAMQLRHSLERELEDKARRLREESPSPSSSSSQMPARIVATPASMRTSSGPSSSASLVSNPDASSSLSSPHASSPAASVSSYSMLHESPVAVMQHVHQCLPFLASYSISPRDFVIQDLRLPCMAFNSADLLKPFIMYSNPAFNRLIGAGTDEPLAGYPLMRLWAETKECGSTIEALIKNKPPMYISEFIFAEPLVRCATGPPVRISFLTQFFFDSVGLIRYAVACAQSWRVDMPREDESLCPVYDSEADLDAHLSACAAALDDHHHADAGCKQYFDT